MEKLIKILATALGAGYMPKAPGTFGSLWGVALFYVLKDQPLSIMLAISTVVTLLAILVSGRAEKLWGQKDCQRIVIDEVAGQLCLYTFVSYSLFNLLVGFFLFRLFDVVKIFPADKAQNLRGGLGVVADDVVAGIQGGIVLYLLNTYLPL